MQHPLSTGQLHIGCAVWSFRGWNGTLYPEDTEPADMLRLYGQRLTAVEGNTTFYATPTAETSSSWARDLPEGFRFCPKLSRTITHAEGLSELGDRDAVMRFLEPLRPLQSRAGPVFAQLPGRFGPRQRDDLARFLEDWPRPKRPSAGVHPERASAGVHPERASAGVHPEGLGREKASTEGLGREKASTEGLGREKASTEGLGREFSEHEWALQLEVRHPDWFIDPHSDALDALLRAFDVGRVMLDTRPIYECPDDPQVHSERRKPEVPLLPHPVTRTAMIRYIGHPTPERNTDYLAVWAERIDGWLRQGISVLFFAHCPMESRSPDLARRLHTALTARGAPVPALPWDRVVRPQLDLFSR